MTLSNALVDDLKVRKVLAFMEHVSSLKPDKMALSDQLFALTISLETLSSLFL